MPAGWYVWAESQFQINMINRMFGYLLSLDLFYILSLPKHIFRKIPSLRNKQLYFFIHCLFVMKNLMVMLFLDGI